MKGITFIAKGKAALIEEEKPVCQNDTILLKTTYSGLTNGTERNVLMEQNYFGGKWPDRCAYQKVSQVIECGQGITRYQKGDIVFTGILSGHVEYHLARESDLIIKLPAGFDLEAGALLGVAAVSLHDARRAGVGPQDNVLIYGAGLIGQLAAQASKTMGARVTVADLDQERLELALKLGANTIVNPATEEGQAILQLNKPYSVVFECSGADVLGGIIGTNWGNGLIGYRARVVMVAGRHDVHYHSNAAQGAEVAVMHANHFDQDDLNMVVELVGSGQLNIRLLIRDVVPVDKAIAIYDTLRDNPNQLLGTVFCWN
jgi:2-desacetyl-2-hydroxyethyl bacteriochlorophyllide A dehydrogenase